MRITVVHATRGLDQAPRIDGVRRENGINGKRQNPEKDCRTQLFGRQAMPEIGKPLLPRQETGHHDGDGDGCDRMADAAKHAGERRHEERGGRGELRALVEPHALHVQKNDEQRDGPKAGERVGGTDHRAHTPEESREAEGPEAGVLAAPFAFEADEEPHEQREGEASEALERDPGDRRCEGIHRFGRTPFRIRTCEAERLLPGPRDNHRDRAQRSPYGDGRRPPAGKGGGGDGRRTT